MLSNIKDCNYCHTCKKIIKVYECKKNILYPYGNYYNKSYHSNHYSNKNLNFPMKLTLTDDYNNNGNCNCNCDYDCDYECKKLIPVNNEISYSTSNNSCNSCNSCTNTKKKCCNNYVNPCDKTNVCQNNVYPSQHQFMYYKTGYGDCYINNNFDQETRMNAYAIYPNIRNF